MSSPANIVINFTSNVADGCHNAYWGTIPGGPYPNNTIISCTPGVGVPCTAYLPITINNESCDPVTWYGYIEACCNTEEAGQIPFSVVFTPSEPCQAVELTCTQPGGCGPISLGLGPNCDGLPYGNWTAKAENEVFNVCYVDGITGADYLDKAAAIAAAGYEALANTDVCCYNCVYITITCLAMRSEEHSSELQSH